MLEWLFINVFIIFALCFLIGIAVTLKYDSDAEKLFKWYNQLINLMTWTIFILIPTGAIILIKKFLSCIF